MEQAMCWGHPVVLLLWAPPMLGAGLGPDLMPRPTCGRADIAEGGLRSKTLLVTVGLETPPHTQSLKGKRCYCSDKRLVGFQSLEVLSLPWCKPT